ncbi:MAG: hypothetical protein ACRDTT_27660, partial [Pseudonocardiaceae bacterium]
MSGITLDAGALVAFEHNQRPVVVLVARAYEPGDRLAVPAGMVGQTWRDGGRQARSGSPSVPRLQLGVESWNAKESKRRETMGHEALGGPMALVRMRAAASDLEHLFLSGVASMLP